MNTTTYNIIGHIVTLIDSGIRNDALHDGYNTGKVKIQLYPNENYSPTFSYYWGSMGKPLKLFLLNTNAQYFTGKIKQPSDIGVIDVKKTFIEIRRFFREDFGLAWYEEMEFQKNFRKSLKEFQEDCKYNDSRYFVDFWSNFINSLDYYLLKDDTWEEAFYNIEEHWSFIVTKPSETEVLLSNIFIKLQKILKKELVNKQ